MRNFNTKIVLLHALDGNWFPRFSPDEVTFLLPMLNTILNIYKYRYVYKHFTDQPK